MPDMVDNILGRDGSRPGRFLPGLAQEAADGVGRLGALRDPVVEAVNGQLGIASGLARVINADLLDKFAVARAALIRNHHPVIGAILRAFAAQSNGNHNLKCLLF